MMHNFAISGIAAANLAGGRANLDGFIVNFSTNYAAAGFGGGVTISAFFDDNTGGLHLLATGEGGLIPLSKFKTQRGLNWLLSAGLIWNADNGVKDLLGGSNTATWPCCMMGWVVPNPIKASSYWGLMMNLAKAVKNTPRRSQATLQISQSWSGAVETSLGYGSYSFGAMAGGTVEVPLGTILSRFGRVVGETVAKVVSTLRSLSSTVLGTSQGLVNLFNRVQDTLNE